MGLRIMNYDDSRGWLLGVLDQAEDLRLGGAGEGRLLLSAPGPGEQGLGHALVRREVEEVGDGGGGHGPRQGGRGRHPELGRQKKLLDFGRCHFRLFFQTEFRAWRITESRMRG